MTDQPASDPAPLGGDPTTRNRLDEEQSPYLQQHADNPVNWQPWDGAALEAARERDIPIFLSIGYSACHWCHVMEAESFADEDVAAILNERFVPIKVDREERPDLDSLYMTTAQQATGRGGWPLSVWLTPGGKPFYVGTYFPPEPKRGQPGFEELLTDIAESWTENRDAVEERAEEWASSTAEELESVPEQSSSTPDSTVLDAAAEAASRQADRTHGGFGRSPKFPQPRRIELLFRAAERNDTDGYREIATEALDAMASGGLYDHLGGGFHRYATDREWTVPHFEKMLYDQAQLLQVYLSGYQVTGEQRYATVVRETLDFLDRELSDPAGGFYSTLDAQSEGEEGTFYVWTPDAVRNELTEELATLFCERFGVTAAGNFEGSSVLTIHASIDSLAEQFDLEPNTVERRLSTARETLFEARSERTRPARDEKILAGWNGLAISACARAGFVLEESAIERATAALEFVREQLWDGTRLMRRFKDGDVAGQGYLEDYAFLARGALDLYGVTGEVEHLQFAVQLGEVIVEEFWDKEVETLYFTPASGESLLARPQQLGDQSTPSSVGVAVDLLLDLGQFTSESAFEQVATGVLETYGETIESNPIRYVSLALAADRLTTGPLELTVVGDTYPAAWREQIGAQYSPDLLLAPRPAAQSAVDDAIETVGLEEPPAIWAGRDGSEPTAYVCRRACSPPLTGLEELDATLEEFSLSGQ